MVDEKILIADDDEASVLMVKACLESNGFEVLTAKDGNEALELTIAHQPAIVILDILMLGMDGFAVSEKIRSLKGDISKTLIIIMSAKEKLEVLFDALHIFAFLKKPIDCEELIMQVKQGLAKVQRQRGISDGEMPFDNEN